MLYGIANNGTRIRAHRNACAACPHCRGPLIPKCGEIKIHHWAHKEAKSCPYSSGTTLWHYEWLVNFDDLAKDGWEVEYFFKSIRFDAFNPERKQAVEFQRSVDLDYARTKISLCRSEGVRLFWLISPHLFKNFIYARNFMNRKEHCLFALRACKRKIDTLFDSFLGTDNVVFAIDFREKDHLPSYVSREVHTTGWYLHYDATSGSMRDFRMTPGIYVVRQVPHIRKRGWRNRTTLFLEYRKSHFA
jgi:hypothetical protein